jgi:uncharacterized protein (DUF697 family)
MHNLSNEYFQNEFETGMNEYGNELSPEFEFENGYSGESNYELSPEFEFEGPAYEVNDHELAQELMEITNEAEFGAWLKKVGKKAAGGAVRFLGSPLGMQATAALGNIAKKTLPGLGGKAGAWAGGKIGGVFGRADAGRQLGQRLGTRAGNAAADRYPDFVRFATDALSNMSQEFEAGTTPAVKPAIVAAAKKHYPVVLRIDVSLPGKRRNSEFEFESNDEFYGESNHEMEGEINHNEGTFNEVTEMELASELLSVQSEMELDQFLGKLFKRAVGAAKNFARSSTGRALGGMLKGLAKKALPIVGKALGSFIPIPGVGTAIGGALGTAASNLFELELEGLSAEDREFEMARAFVRFAGNSAKRATTTSAANPAAAAKTAIVTAAKGYAPGLLAKRQGNTPANRRYNSGSRILDIGEANEGTWHKADGRIILTANI